MRSARLLLDLRGIKKCRDNGGRADPDGNTRLDQLAAALFIRALEIVIAVCHAQTSMASPGTWKVR